MFGGLDICWHTGYKYIPWKKPDRDLPAIKRMKNRVISKEEKKEKENQYYVR